MSIFIKVSYEHDAELTAIVDRLEGLNLRVEVARQKGRYKRAYIKEKAVRQHYSPSEGISTIEEEYPIS